MQQRPILIVDDDMDDIDVVKQVVAHLKIERSVEYFRSGKELADYLKATNVAPLFILCDVNLPGETGFDIKERVSKDNDLKYKSVPFIFWSTDALEHQIQKAYDLPAQGFFFKSTSFEGICETFHTIETYWIKSQHPKKVI